MTFAIDVVQKVTQMGPIDSTTASYEDLFCTKCNDNLYTEFWKSIYIYDVCDIRDECMLVTVGSCVSQPHPSPPEPSPPTALLRQPPQRAARSTGSSVGGREKESSCARRCYLARLLIDMRSDSPPLLVAQRLSTPLAPRPPHTVPRPPPRAVPRATCE